MMGKTVWFAIFLVSVLFIMTPLVYASEDENVNLQDLPKYLSERLGLPTYSDYFVGKLLAGSIILVLFLFPTIFLCAAYHRDVWLPSLLVGMGVLSFNVALGWYPVWIFALIVLLIAILYANKFKGMV